MKSAHAKTGRKSQKEALLCAAIVMKCEGFGYITDLHDYLSNNLIIAHYCGFNIMKKLPSYWTFDRFIRNMDNEILKGIMQSQVIKLCELGFIDTSFIGLDSTPLAANTKQNNPKSFMSGKYSKDHLECSFLADKAYDSKDIYNTVKNTYDGECFIPLNQRNTKNNKKLPIGNPICETGLAMHRDGICRDNGRSRQKFCCPFKRTSHIHDCPCSHKSFLKGKNTGCTKYITLPDDYRLSINRDTIDFKSVYALRTECERYNARFKSTGQERLWVRNGKSVENLNTIAHIALLAVALAAVVTQSKLSYRCIKSQKRIA